MDKTLSAALSALHKSVLKPAGFSKNGGTFSRVHADYMELVNIQSSQWNAPENRAFYVNYGAAFKDLSKQFPPRPSLSSFQWGCRVQYLVPGTPDKWGYSDKTIERVREELGRCILRASTALERDLAKHKQQYLDTMTTVAKKRRANA